MSTALGAATVQVETHGRVAPADVTYARDRIDGVLRFAPAPVLRVRVKLTRLGNPALHRRSLAQTNLELNGLVLRVQAARPTMGAAVDEAHDRLRDRLQRAAGRWEAIPGRRTQEDDGEWWRSGRRLRLPSFFPGPKDERVIVRHKAFTLDRLSVDDAAYEMASLDYTFHLFTEAGSGVDSVLSRPGRTSRHRFDQLCPQTDLLAVGMTPLAINAHPAPRQSVAQALSRLDAGGGAFAFFRDDSSDRAAVVYHRYEGHYGLITPAD